jgi:hypothetical protein
VLTVFSACSVLRDERGKGCGFLDEPVAAQFAMEHASDYHLHIPKMGISPELDENIAPAFVVAFARPIFRRQRAESAAGLGRSSPSSTWSASRSVVFRSTTPTSI